MIYRGEELKDKQIVCVKSGTIIGNVSDLEFDSESGKITALIIYGKAQFFGLFGKENDIIIPWEKIEVIGKETVLVDVDNLKI